MASTDELYVQYLRHKYIGYGKTTTRALLDHLYSTYANISVSALQDNDKRLCAAYDSNQPFETLIDQVENVVAYASTGDMPYTLAQVVGIALQLMFQIGILTTTERYGDANQQTSIHGPDSRNFSPRTTKNGVSRRRPQLGPFSSQATTPISRPTTPTKTKRSKPSRISRRTRPVIAPRLPTSL